MSASIRFNLFKNFSVCLSGSGSSKRAPLIRNALSKRYYCSLKATMKFWFFQRPRYDWSGRLSWEWGAIWAGLEFSIGPQSLWDWNLSPRFTVELEKRSVNSMRSGSLWLQRTLDPQYMRYSWMSPQTSPDIHRYPWPLLVIPFRLVWINVFISRLRCFRSFHIMFNVQTLESIHCLARIGSRVE